MCIRDRLEGIGSFILQDAFGGAMVNVDMTEEGTLELTNPALNLLKLKVTPSGDGPPPPPSGDPDFIAQVSAFDGDISYNMGFGFSPDATDGYDPGIDDYAPPAPPPPSFDAALGWDGIRYYTQIVHGSSDDLVEHEWEIQLQFSTSNQITLVWNNISSDLGTFVLQDAFGGTMINVDMTQQDSYLVDNPSFTVLKILVTPLGGDEEFSGPHWHVSVDGSDETGNGSVQEPFATVQKAVDMAGVQDTIHVHPGTYFENITVENKNLVINGQAGPSVTILDGDGGRVVEFTNVGQPAMLKGFTIQNGYLSLIHISEPTRRYAIG